MENPHGGEPLRSVWREGDVKPLATIIIRDRRQAAVGARTADALRERGMEVRVLILSDSGELPEGESLGPLLRLSRYVLTL